MNNYHIYEEIGHGKHSVVYKGRFGAFSVPSGDFFSENWVKMEDSNEFLGKKKKSIQYVAVKSVEKSWRLKVNNESRILNALEPNPNIIKFYNFFETRNHLWLIFEFCPGGDLYNLLQVDK